MELKKRREEEVAASSSEWIWRDFMFYLYTDRTLLVMTFFSKKKEYAKKELKKRLCYLDCLKRNEGGLNIPRFREIASYLTQLTINVYKISRESKWRKLYRECNKFYEIDFFLKKVNFDQIQKVDEELFFNISFDIKQKKEPSIKTSRILPRQPRSLFSLSLNNMVERFGLDSEYLTWWILPLMGHEKFYRFEGDLIKENIFLETLGIYKSDLKISEFVYKQKKIAGELWAFHKSWCDKCTYSEDLVLTFNSSSEYFFPLIEDTCFYKGTKLFSWEKEILIEWIDKRRDLEIEEVDKFNSFMKEYAEFRKLFSSKKPDVDTSSDPYHPYYSFICFVNRRCVEYIKKVEEIKQWAFSFTRELLFLEREEIKERKINELLWSKDLIELKRKDYYASLGIQRSANEREIRESFSFMITRWQSTKGTLYCGLNEELLEEGVWKINKSYAVLCNYQWRRLYDYWIFGLKKEGVFFDKKIEYLKKTYNLCFEDKELFLRMCDLVGWKDIDESPFFLYDNVWANNANNKGEVVLVKKGTRLVRLAETLDLTKEEKKDSNIINFSLADSILFVGFFVTIILVFDTVSKFIQGMF